MKSMEHVNDILMTAAIDGMEPEFSSDEWIAEIRRIAPHAYVRELYKKIAAKDPIQQTHADMASRLLYSPFEGIVMKIGDVPATSIKGTPTIVARWKKLNPRVYFTPDGNPPTPTP
jgi:hypothetical protein